MAVQQAGVNWVHQDPFVKSKRITNDLGAVVSVVELDPWGGETNRSSNEAFQPKKFTSYVRDVIASDDAMHRRYNRWWSRFEQPDPYNGSYNLTNPQSFNRYTYVNNDPVNFIDPFGLDPQDPRTPAIDPATGRPYPGGVPGPTAVVDVIDGRGSGLRGGRGNEPIDIPEEGPEENPTVDGPEGPQTPHPHGNSGNLPFNSCAEFVDFLVKEAVAAFYSQPYDRESKVAVLSLHLIDLAFNGYERHINNGWSGFKDVLTGPGNQNAGVYGHILGQGGAMLGGAPTMIVGGLADAYDTAQRLFGTKQSPAEMAGNRAGWEVGRHIYNFLTGKTPSDPDRLRNSLTSELCK